MWCGIVAFNSDPCLKYRSNGRNTFLNMLQHFVNTNQCMWSFVMLAFVLLFVQRSVMRIRNKIWMLLEYVFSRQLMSKASSSRLTLVLVLNSSEPTDISYVCLLDRFMLPHPPSITGTHLRSPWRWGSTTRCEVRALGQFCRRRLDWRVGPNRRTGWTTPRGLSL